MKKKKRKTLFLIQSNSIILWLKIVQMQNKMKNKGEKKIQKGKEKRKVKIKIK